jgi:hypothetical protein
MTGCVTGGSADLMRRLDALVEALVPAVADILGGLAGDVAPTVTSEDGTQVVTVPLRFPDGVGGGQLQARIFRYRTAVRVDLRIVHNRVIALADGSPTDRPCFLNDFVASVTLDQEATSLPDAFAARVEQGVRAALAAVENHNRRHPQPWGRILVAAS